MSAISYEAGRCFKMPNKLGGRAAQCRVARGDPSILEVKSGVRLQGTIFNVSFNLVAFDESHTLRNVSLMTLAAIQLSAKALVCVGATATPIFTGPKDIAAQGRVLRHAPIIGDAGEELFLALLAEQRARTKQWEENSLDLIEQAANKEAMEMAATLGATHNEARIAELLEQARQKYESEDQERMLKTSYVMQTSIDMLRQDMLPIVLRRSGTSKGPDGNCVLELQPYKIVTAWSPLSEKEQEGLDRVNEVQKEQKELRKLGKKHNTEVLKWSNFLLDQKHAGLHPDILPLRNQEKAEGLEPGSLLDHMADDWNEANILEKASTRLLKTDEIIGHFWSGNPNPPVYHEDGTRDLEAEALVQDPEPLDHPRKFLVYVQYKLHRMLLKQLLKIRGRGLVEYDGTMTTSKRQAAVKKFQEDPECRVMLISNVGAAGLNLAAASIVIFVLTERRLVRTGEEANHWACMAIWTDFAGDRHRYHCTNRAGSRTGWLCGWQDGHVGELPPI
ncbi:SNF2-related protein [Ceratobasidium theobromae]|uniref:SNF2-related protein n=1 Tax=Ceratobasidium theobromae TaxID=1582974 RepID=A0A5N5Q825_9AGAM|nr:SNF2-related protein [Ceratobasidium theobromae]